MDITYSIEFNTYWHIGSGLSGGVEVDSLVLKDNDTDALPYIPGKTLKGLLREAAEVLKELNTEIDDVFLSDFFGKRTEDLKKKELDERESGKLFFSNAYLDKSLQKDIVENHLTPQLYHKIALNRIDAETGTTVKNSLREIEVCIPLTLYAQIQNVPDVESVKKIEKCLKMVKRMGLNRNRGLGRCELKIVKEVKDEN